MPDFAFFYETQPSLVTNRIKHAKLRTREVDVGDDRTLMDEVVVYFMRPEARELREFSTRELTEIVVCKVGDKVLATELINYPFKKAKLHFYRKPDGTLFRDAKIIRRCSSTNERMIYQICLSSPANPPTQVWRWIQELWLKTGECGSVGQICNLSPSVGRNGCADRLQICPTVGSGFKVKANDLLSGFRS